MQLEHLLIIWNFMTHFTYSVRNNHSWKNLLHFPGVVCTVRGRIIQMDFGEDISVLAAGTELSLLDSVVYDINADTSDQRTITYSSGSVNVETPEMVCFFIFINQMRNPVLKGKWYTSKIIDHFVFFSPQRKGTIVTSNLLFSASSSFRNGITLWGKNLHFGSKFCLVDWTTLWEEKNTFVRLASLKSVFISIKDMSQVG